MEINRRLNLVVPVERDDGSKVYVHSTPISQEVYERYFLEMSKAFALIHGEGLSIVAGPRVAALMLKRVAQDMKTWDGDAGVGKGLMAEIRRLSNVAVPTATGWEVVPLQVALDRNFFDAADVAEVEGYICFFILTSAINKRRQIPGLLAGLNGLWGTQTTLLNSTEYASSLRTLTETGSSTKLVADLSQPT